MSDNSEYYHRRSIRLKGYDYSRAGAYFVTICTQNRDSLFGDIADNQVMLKELGKMVKTTWDTFTRYYGGVDTDHFVVMPNHIHGITVLGAEREFDACPDSDDAKSRGQPRRVAPCILKSTRSERYIR